MEVSDGLVRLVEPFLAAVPVLPPAVGVMDSEQNRCCGAPAGGLIVASVAMALPAACQSITGAGLSDIGILL
jgi:hypothetical protein